MIDPDKSRRHWGPWKNYKQTAELSTNILTNNLTNTINQDREKNKIDTLTRYQEILFILLLIVFILIPEQILILTLIVLLKLILLLTQKDMGMMYE